MRCGLFDENLMRLTQLAPEVALAVRLAEGWGYPPLEELACDEGFVQGDSDWLAIFGMARLGEAALNWLASREKRRLLFVEADVERIAAWLSAHESARLLEGGRVEFVIASGELEPLRSFALRHLGLKGCVVVTDGFKERHPELAREGPSELLGASESLSRIEGEFLREGRLFYSNFYRNFFLLQGLCLASTLKERFAGVPAVICGSGPSLPKELEPLRGIQERALIFAAGSAINILREGGITPHFFGACDPHPFQYQRVVLADAYEVALLFSGRWNHEAHKLWHGPRLLVSGEGGYPIAGWLEEEVGIGGSDLQDTGRNVAHLCLSMAEEFGCNPIIFVGMDLAYTGGKSYGDGVLLGESEQDLVESRQESESIPARDIFGMEVMTHPQWLAESGWISHFARGHSETRLINATGGGIGFQGVENLPFEQVVGERLNRCYPLRQMVHAAIQEGVTSVSREPLLKALLKLEASLSRAEALLREWVARPHEKVMELLFEVELGEELCYELILEGPDRLFKASHADLDDRPSRPLFLLRSVQTNLELLRAARDEYEQHLP